MNVAVTSRTAPRRPSEVVPDLEWTVYDSLEACEQDWRALQGRALGRVFQSYDWVAAWHRHLGAGEGVALRVVVGRKGDTPCLLFPLGLKPRFGVSTLVWLAGDWNDYNAPLVSREPTVLATERNVAALWNEVVDVAGPADLVELVKQSPTLDGILPNPLRPLGGVPEDNSAYILDLHSDIDALRASIHGAKTWKTYERKRRKLGREGVVSFAQVPDAEEAEALVRRMLGWKSASLDARGASNPFLDTRAADFLAGMAGMRPDSFRVYALRVDATARAIAFCLVEGDNLILYQMAYDPQRTQGSPGGLLTHDLIAAAAREGFASLDFSFGDDPYKVEICNRTVTLTRVIAPLSVAGVLPAGLARGSVHLRRWVKDHRSLYHAALSVNRRMRGVVPAGASG